MNENDGTGEEIPFELDNEFILRLPPPYAANLRSAIRNEEKHIKNRFQIQIEPDKRHAKVKLDEHILKAKIYDLPSLIESHKTLDRKVFYKVGDICHIMVCEADETSDSSEEEGSEQKLDRDGREKKYLFSHGVTPPLKNIRKRRFRRTLRNKYTESPSIEKEIRILLKTDAEAISSRYEIVSVDEEKANDKNEFGDTQPDESQPQKLGEYDIFGEVSSSSEDSDVDVSDGVMNVSVDRSLTNGETQELMQAQEETDSDVEVEESLKSDVIIEENVASDKIQLHNKLAELEQNITKIQDQKLTLERNLAHVENAALRQRLQMTLENLEAEELRKQADHNEILLFLEHSEM